MCPPGLQKSSPTTIRLVICCPSLGIVCCPRDTRGCAFLARCVFVCHFSLPTVRFSQPLLVLLSGCGVVRLVELFLGGLNFCVILCDLILNSMACVSRVPCPPPRSFPNHVHEPIVCVFLCVYTIYTFGHDLFMLLPLL